MQYVKSEAYLEPSQILKRWSFLLFLAKKYFILDVWLGSEYN